MVGLLVSCLATGCMHPVAVGLEAYRRIKHHDLITQACCLAYELWAMRGKCSCGHTGGHGNLLQGKNRDVWLFTWENVAGMILMSSPVETARMLWCRFVVVVVVVVAAAAAVAVAVVDVLSLLFKASGCWYAADFSRGSLQLVLRMSHICNMYWYD